MIGSIACSEPTLIRGITRRVYSCVLRLITQRQLKDSSEKPQRIFADHSRNLSNKEQRSNEEGSYSNFKFVGRERSEAQHWTRSVQLILNTMEAYKYGTKVNEAIYGSDGPKRSYK
jgi:hypothetical protein